MKENIDGTKLNNFPCLIRKNWKGINSCLSYRLEKRVTFFEMKNLYKGIRKYFKSIWQIQNIKRQCGFKIPVAKTLLIYEIYKCKQQNIFERYWEREQGMVPCPPLPTPGKPRLNKHAELFIYLYCCLGRGDAAKNSSRWRLVKETSQHFVSVCM